MVIGPGSVNVLPPRSWQRRIVTSRAACHDDAVHNDEVTTFGVTSGSLRDNLYNDRVLIMCFRLVRWDRSSLDEMPEVISMKVDLR